MKNTEFKRYSKPFVNSNVVFIQKTVTFNKMICEKGRLNISL